MGVFLQLEYVCYKDSNIEYGRLSLLLKSWQELADGG
jgi:hypothetical protein